jgi:hypothetical protein
MAMRRALRGLPFILLPALCVPAFTARVPTYPCYRPPVAPVMDGRVTGDPAWETVPAVTGFSKLGDGYTEAKQTWARACWDEQAFYVGIVCEEPDIAHMQLQVRDGGDTWLDDGIEVFLLPSGSLHATQFVVTAGAARGGYEGAPDILRYQAATHAGEASYELEVRIPFDLLGVTPKPGDRWRGNFCRNIWTTQSGGDKFTSWAPLQTRFLEPEHFATFEFAAAPPDAAQVSAIADHLNAAYRADLTKRVQAAATAGREYLPALTEASAADRFRPKALELRRGWRELDRALANADTTPLLELRRLLKGAQALTQGSYDLKYAYLIATVLGD